MAETTLDVTTNGMTPPIAIRSSGTPRPGAPAWNLGVQRRDRQLWSDIRARVNQDVGRKLLKTVDLQEMLRQLNGITLPNGGIRGEEFAAMIAALVEIVPHDEMLCPEFMRFVQKSCMREQVGFTSQQLPRIIRYLLRYIQHCQSWYTCGSIRTLGLVLHDNADRATEMFEEIFSVLLKYLDPSDPNLEARYAATSCVSNILSQAGKTPVVVHFFPAVLRMVVENVRLQTQTLVQGNDDRMLLRACTSSMKCSNAIIQSTHDRIADRIEANLQGLLNSMRQVVGFGLVLESDRNERISVLSRGDISPAESDSSLGGADSGGSLTARSNAGEGLLARLRITVLTTLEAIARHFPKAITSCVGLYLPEQTTPFMTLFQRSPSVLTLLIADPCERARIEAARFLEVFWEQMPLKHYFRQMSSFIAPSTSFASMPQRISNMLYQVHVTLVYCIGHETQTSPLVQILKTTTSVIQHCPYKNVLTVLEKADLNPSLAQLLMVLASSLYSTMAHPDHSVHMASLSCLSALFNVQEQIEPIAEWMVMRHGPRQILEVAHIQIVWDNPGLSNNSLIEELLLIAARADDSTKNFLRLDAMSLLSKIAKNYPMALSSNWRRLGAFMVSSFQDSDPNVRLQAMKILENYIKGEGASKTESGFVHVNSPARTSADTAATNIAKTVATTSTNNRSNTRWAYSQHTAGPHQECLEFMSTHLMRAFHDTSHHVRASVCACFTLLRPKDWVRLESVNRRSFVDTYTRTFLQTPRDSSPVVRAAGFRLLGSLCLAPTFKTPKFADAVVAKSLEALTDLTLNVRVRAAWALGNVCTTSGPEAVVQHETVHLREIVLYDLLPATLMQLIIERMLVHVNDNDKVASSVSRTLGLVCRWIFFEPFLCSIGPDTLESLRGLLHQTMLVLSAKISNGSPKVRWNACHAIAKVLLCPGLPLASATWAPAVFQALINAISQQENFKVRISASSALRVSISRSSYGAFFKRALIATVNALETASDLQDVTEFRYKEQLETQLSFTLVHLLHLATEEDDSMIWETLRSKPKGFLYDWLLHNLHRMCTVIESENDGDRTNNGEGSTSGAGQGRDACDGGSGGGDGGEVHDVNPIKKEEILSAIRTLLRILQNRDKNRSLSSTCLTLLYDAKLSLERELLYSNEDLAFEL